MQAQPEKRSVSEIRFEIGIDAARIAADLAADIRNSGATREAWY